MRVFAIGGKQNVDISSLSTFILTEYPKANSGNYNTDRKGQVTS